MGKKNECLLDNNMTIDTLIQQATNLRGQKLRFSTLQINLLRQLAALKQQVATVQKSSAAANSELTTLQAQLATVASSQEAVNTALTLSMPYCGSRKWTLCIRVDWMHRRAWTPVVRSCKKQVVHLSVTWNEEDSAFTLPAGQVGVYAGAQSQITNLMDRLSALGNILSSNVEEDSGIERWFGWTAHHAPSTILHENDLLMGADFYATAPSTQYNLMDQTVLLKYTVNSTGLQPTDTLVPSIFSTILGYSLPNGLVALHMAGHKTTPFAVPLFLLVESGGDYTHGYMAVSNSAEGTDFGYDFVHSVKHTVTLAFSINTSNRTFSYHIRCTGEMGNTLADIGKPDVTFQLGHPVPHRTRGTCISLRAKIP